ncbi:hypothetical protein GCM10010272_52280 [Streptomyces lateritius]|nr:hypothetical protein GCM10010272_52280 [Streptomyces lateritius]
MLPEVKEEPVDAWAGAGACTTRRAPAAATAAVTTNLFTRASKGGAGESARGRVPVGRACWGRLPGSRERYLRHVGARRAGRFAAAAGSTPGSFRDALSVLISRYMWSRGVRRVSRPSGGLVGAQCGAPLYVGSCRARSDSPTVRRRVPSLQERCAPAEVVEAEGTEAVVCCFSVMPGAVRRVPGRDRGSGKACKHCHRM